METVSLHTEQRNRICFLNRHSTTKNEFKPHTHNCYEIIYFLSGEGEICIDGTCYPVNADTYCVIPPKTIHTELLNSSGEIVFIGFKYADTALWGEGVYNAADKTTLLLFEKIFDEYSKQNVGYDISAEALLDLLLVSYIREKGERTPKYKDMAYIKTYIEQYFNEKISFGELAKLSGYSYDYFRFLFKKSYGCSPQKYLLDIRLEKAKDMLKSTSLSCTDIAYNCGFSNGAQMTTMIKRRYNKTPMSLRNTD